MSFIIRAGLDRAFCLFRSSTGPAEGRIIGQSLLRRQGLKVKEEDPEGQMTHSQDENVELIASEYLKKYFSS